MNQTAYNNSSVILNNLNSNNTNNNNMPNILSNLNIRQDSPKVIAEEKAKILENYSMDKLKNEKNSLKIDIEKSKEELSLIRMNYNNIGNKTQLRETELRNHIQHLSGRAHNRDLKIIKDQIVKLNEEILENIHNIPNKSRFDLKERKKDIQLKHKFLLYNAENLHKEKLNQLVKDQEAFLTKFDYISEENIRIKRNYEKIKAKCEKFKLYHEKFKVNIRDKEIDNYDIKRHTIMFQKIVDEIKFQLGIVRVGKRVLLFSGKYKGIEKAQEMNKVITSKSIFNKMNKIQNNNFRNSNTNNFTNNLNKVSSKYLPNNKDNKDSNRKEDPNSLENFIKLKAHERKISKASAALSNILEHEKICILKTISNLEFYRKKNRFYDAFICAIKKLKRENIMLMSSTGFNNNNININIHNTNNTNNTNENNNNKNNYSLTFYNKNPNKNNNNLHMNNSNINNFNKTSYTNPVVGSIPISNNNNNKKSKKVKRASFTQHAGVLPEISNKSNSIYFPLKEERMKLVDLICSNTEITDYVDNMRLPVQSIMKISMSNYK